MKKILLISIPIIASVILVLFFIVGRVSKSDEPIVNIPAGTSPFGSGEGFISEEVPTTLSNEEGVEELYNEEGVPVANFFRVSDGPVAGAVVFTRNTQTIVRYVERSTGHISEVVLPQRKATEALAPRKISNNTLPKVYEAHFRSDGSSVLLRMLENDTDAQRNLTLNLATTSSGTLLRGVLGDVATGAGNSLIYTVEDSKIIASSDFSGNNIKALLNTSFMDWRLAQAGTGVLMFTKPAANYPGYAYILNSAGSLNKILGPLNALSATIDPTGNQLFYSYKDKGFAKSSTINLRTGVVVEISPATLSEKCVWMPKKTGRVICGVPTGNISSREPDSWYRGETSFSDRIWEFDTNQEIAQILEEPKPKFNIDLDVIEPKISPSEDYLIFMNKRDMTLWALKLSEL